MDDNYVENLMVLPVATAYPVSAVWGAAAAGAGWFSVGFAPLGLVVGVLLVGFGKPIVYRGEAYGVKWCQHPQPLRLRWYLFRLVNLWHLIAPLAFVGFGVWFSFFFAGWFARVLFN